MARQIERLTDARVRKAKHSGSTTKKGTPVAEYHHDGAGLYLVVSATNAKSWVFSYTRNGKTREMGLGSVQKVTLAEARSKARDQHQLLDEGKDPIAVRDAARAEEGLKLARQKTLTFAECAPLCIERRKDKKKWRNEKHAEQWMNTLAKYAFPVIGRLAVRDINRSHVLRILDPLWTRKTETASRVRSRIEIVLDWATVNGYRDKNIENPARWRGNLDHDLGERREVQPVQHHTAMKCAEIAAFIKHLRTQPGVGVQALEFLILTASRTGEVRGARWDEFDLENGLWTIPGERMKMKKEHCVPLSPRAIEIVQAQPRSGEYVFSGRSPKKPMSDGTLLMAIERAGRGEVTVHGFRSTFRDWAAEKTAHPNFVVEMALAHTVGGVEKAYRRGELIEKRRHLMIDWANFCEGVEAPARNELPEDHPARIAYEKALREMTQARPTATVVRLKTHSVG